MLTINAISSTDALVSYYANLALRDNHHEYYTEGSVRPGYWWGEGSKALGLEGAVSPEVFSNLLRGISPDGKRFLVQQNLTSTRKRRAGFDLTWSVPKSLSCLWSLLPQQERDRLDSIMERALHRSLEAYVELCGVARRGKNGHTLEDAKPVVAVFSHDTARGISGQTAPDPNRHYHAIVCNVCIRDSDQTTGAIDSRFLFQRRMKMALGALFRSELSKLLSEEVGLSFYRPERGRKKNLASWWEITGIPQSVIAAMSKRRQAIEKWLKKHGLTGAKSAERAALATREDKEKHTWKELNSAWATLGKEFGFSTDQANALIRAKEPSKAVTQKDVATAALNSLTQSKARFTFNELLEQAAIEAQTSGLGIDGVFLSVSNLIENSEELVPLQDSKGVAAFSTKKMLRTERRLVSSAIELSRRSLHPVSVDTTTRVIQEIKTLRPDQARVVRAMVHGGDAVSITGIAGSGKTFAMRAARRAFGLSGYSVYGTTLAAKTSQRLQNESGIESDYLHNLLSRIERHEFAITERSVIFLDEAGMVGTVMFDKLLCLVKDANAKIVMVGDHLQLQAIDAGAPFRLASEKIGTTALTKVIRQKEEWARETVKQFRDGESERALLELEKRGRLHVAEDREQMLTEAVSTWRGLIESGKGTTKNTVIIAGTNFEVEQVNERAQEVMRETGQLGEYAVVVGDIGFHLGDRVAITKNNHRLGLRNGMTGEVVGAWDSVLAIRTDDGFQVEVDTQRFDDIDLSYCSNLHRFQGASVRNCLFLTGDSMTNREVAYVAASRAKEKTFIFTDEESVADLHELAERMAESDLSENAVEHLRQEVTW